MGLFPFIGTLGATSLAFTTTTSGPFFIELSPNTWQVLMSISLLCCEIPQCYVLSGGREWTLKAILLQKKVK